MSKCSAMCLGTSMLTSLIFDLMRGWLEKVTTDTGVMVHTCDPRTLEVEVGKSWILGHLDNIARPCLRKPNQSKPKQNQRLHCVSVSCHAGCNCDVTHCVLVGRHPCPLWQSVLSVPLALSLKHKFRVCIKMEEMESCRNVYLKELGIFHRA